MKCHRLRMFFGVMHGSAVCANCDRPVFEHVDAACTVPQSKIGNRCPRCGQIARKHEYDVLPDSKVQSEKVEKNAAYWRGLAAAAAKIECAHVTQFSPAGFREALGQSLWFYVSLAELRLTRDGEWVFPAHRDEATAEERMKYAFKSDKEALAALRAAVAPDEPYWAQIIEGVKRGG